jgi:hypothetical protein
MRGYAVYVKGGVSLTNGSQDNPLIQCPFNDSEKEQPNRDFDKTDPCDEE